MAKCFRANRPLVQSNHTESLVPLVESEVDVDDLTLQKFQQLLLLFLGLGPYRNFRESMGLFVAVFPFQNQVWVTSCRCAFKIRPKKVHGFDTYPHVYGEIVEI